MNFICKLKEVSNNFLISSKLYLYIIGHQKVFTKMMLGTHSTGFPLLLWAVSFLQKLLINNVKKNDRIRSRQIHGSGGNSEIH